MGKSTVEKVQLLIEKGLEGKISAFADKLLLEKKLNQELLEKLNALGNTPIEEPKVYEAMKKSKMELVKYLLTNEEITKKFTSIEVGDLIYAVEQKIKNMQEADGTFKSTPNTENCNLPNFLEVDEIHKEAEKITKLNTEYIKDTSNKKATKALEEAVKEADEKRFKISGLDIEKLTDWEKELVKTQIYYSAIDASLSSVGKSLGNLLIGGLTKNT